MLSIVGFNQQLTLAAIATVGAENTEFQHWFDRGGGARAPVRDEG